MLSPLTEDALVDFFKEGAKMRGPLVAFSSTVLHGWNTFHQGCADSELFKFLWEHDVLSPMVDAADRLQKICCCVLHIFCAESEVPPLIQASSDALVLMFYNYAGNEVFERTFKRVLRDGWWNAEIQDMLKKGGSAALVQAKAADLKDLLSASELSLNQLPHATQLLSEIKDKVRTQKIQSLLDTFAASWFEFERWRLLLYYYHT